MAEQIKKGWLYTREDEKFAPNTLVENVYTRSGTPYDEQVRNYFEAVRRANATTEGETAAKLKEHTSKLENLQQQITNTQDDIEERLKHFQDIDDTGILYITDEAGHVIAYFDASGIHAVDVAIKSGMTLSQAESNISTLQTDLTETQGQIKTIRDSLVNIDASERDTLYILDGMGATPEECNVIAYIDKHGIHAVNVWFGSDTDSEAYGPIRDLISTIETLLLADENINNMLDNHEERIDSLEVWRPEVEQAEVNLGNRITKVANDLSDEASKRSADDKAINQRIDNLDDKVDAEIDRATNTEEDLQKQISENKQNADTRITYLDRVTNFYSSKPNNPANGDLSLEGNNLIIYDSIDKQWKPFNGLSKQLKEKTQYLDAEFSDKFYIVDDNNNTVAYFDESGFHAVNMWVGSTDGTNHTTNVYDVYTQITNLNSGLNSEVSRSTKADEEHDKRLDSIEDRLDNVSNVMDFVGVYQTVQDRDRANPSPNNGDVCVVRDVEGKGYDKEFVYANGAWQEIGDVSAEMARLDELESIVGDPATNVAGTHEARLDGLDSALAQEVIDRTAGDVAINNTLTDMQNNFSWADDNRRLYIIDGTAAQNVLAVFYENGLIIPDVTVKDIKNNKEKNLRSSASYLVPEQEEITITWL